ncbi:MAG: ClpXP protease specificity-enhancing factor [Gammaproteobacteria bacterium]|nr:ClpXP protease specificity-enhancing factor [Gammaproteobacteria bacterium]
MIPQRPYLLRAMYEWIVDNGWTPHILIDTTADDVEIPPGLSDDGQILLNVSERAVHALEFGSERVEFSARFDGVSHQVSAPVERVLAIYANENGEGMAFDHPASDGAIQDHDPQDDGPTDSPPDKGGPNLRVVK